MTNPDNLVEVVDIPADRPESSDRADSGVVYISSAAKAEAMTDEELLNEAGVEPVFSTSEAAEFFDRSNQWLYWGLREGIFVDADGEPIVPDWAGDVQRTRRRFTVPIIREIAKSSYRRGNFTLDHLKKVMLRARYAELGVEWREREGWKRVPQGRRGTRWVAPDKARKNPTTKEWERKPKRKKASK